MFCQVHLGVIRGPPARDLTRLSYQAPLTCRLLSGLSSLSSSSSHSSFPGFADLRTDFSGRTAVTLTLAHRVGAGQSPRHQCLSVTSHCRPHAITSRRTCGNRYSWKRDAIERERVSLFCEFRWIHVHERPVSPDHPNALELKSEAPFAQT